MCLIKKILFVILLFLTSCTTYRFGHMPDELYYYSNGIQISDRKIRQEEYQNYTSSRDVNYLRMRVNNRTRWSLIDDFDYWNSPFQFPSFGFNPFWTYNMNFFGNPYMFPYWNRPMFYQFNPYYIFPIQTKPTFKPSSSFSILFASRNRVFNNQNSNSSNYGSYHNNNGAPIRSFDGAGTSSSAGGFSGGFNSVGSSSSSSRGSRN